MPCWWQVARSFLAAFGCVLSIVYPFLPNGFADHYPSLSLLNGYFFGNIPCFQTNPFGDFFVSRWKDSPENCDPQRTSFRLRDEIWRSPPGDGGPKTRLPAEVIQHWTMWLCLTTIFIHFWWKLLFWGSTILRNQMSMFFMFFVRGCWRPQELYIGYQLRLQRVKEAQLQNVLRTLTTVANVIEPAIQFKSSNSVSLRGSSFEIHRVLDILWACATSCPGQITEWPGWNEDAQWKWEIQDRLCPVPRCHG